MAIAQSMNYAHVRFTALDEVCGVCHFWDVVIQSVVVLKDAGVDVWPAKKVCLRCSKKERGDG